LSYFFRYNFYYVVIMAYSLYYMFMGFASELPWSKCDDDFAGIHCYSVEEGKKCNGETETFFDHKCMPAEDFCAEAAQPGERYAGELFFDESRPGFCSLWSSPSTPPWRA
jgi:hypothetical protein